MSRVETPTSIKISGFAWTLHGTSSKSAWPVVQSMTRHAMQTVQESTTIFMKSARVDQNVHVAALVQSMTARKQTQF